MRTICRAALALAGIALVLVLLKTGQKYCWDKKISIISPPSLDSWDPTERVEAARRLGNKYGGKP